MAFAIDTYTGNGSTTNFSVTFPYIEQSHIVVTVDGVTKTLTTHYTFSVFISPIFLLITLIFFVILFLSFKDELIRL